MAITNAFLVEVAGAPLADDVAPLLASAHVDDSLDLPDLFVLRFRDPDRVVLAKTGLAIGVPVRVSVLAGDAQAPQLLVAGEVTALEVEADAQGTSTLVRGYDGAHRLFRGRRTQAYTQVTASDVVAQVARRAGLGVDVEATTTVHDHVSQTGTSDWELIDGLAREVGYEVAVREGTLHFRRPSAAARAPDGTRAPDPDPLVLQLGADLLSFRAVVTAADQVTEVRARGWDVAQKRPLVATAPAATAGVELPTVRGSDLAKGFGAPVHLATDVPHGSQAEVDASAAALAEQLAGAFAEFTGVARGNPALRADTAFSVTGTGEPFDGKYTITSSRHAYDPLTGYTTTVAVTGRQDRSLYGLAAGERRPGTVGGAAPGVVVALVSDASDPAQQGRVRLTYPWLDDDYVSDWARTVQPGAGADRGALVLPEVGDEVLVAFDGARRPYVLGGVHNGVDTPPRGPVDAVDAGSGAVARRSVVSRRGHRIDLLDQDGQREGVSVSTGDDALRLVLDATGTAITVHSDGTVLVEGGRGVVVDAGSAALELKGGSIALTATSGVSVDAGTGALGLTGASASLEGATQTVVKGGVVRIN